MKFPSIKGRTVEERFHEKCLIQGDTGCWLWQGATDKDGYGFIRIDGKNVRAHRFALEMKLGRKLLREELACHSCDTPACVNPEHLWAGDSSANQGDSARKGRSRSVRLTPDQVREIRSQHARGVSQADLCRRFRVSDPLVCHIVQRKRWKHVA